MNYTISNPPALASNTYWFLSLNAYESNVYRGLLHLQMRRRKKASKVRFERRLMRCLVRARRGT